MPPVLYTSPPKIAFTRNPIPVVLQSSDYQETAGSHAVNRLTFTGASYAGDVVTLKWAAASVTLTSSTNPDDSGNQFPEGPGSNAHMATVLTWFRSNYYLDRDFVITLVTTGIDPYLQFTAREKGNIYNMTGTLTGNLVLTVITAGASEQIRPSFAHLLELFLEGKKIYSRTLQLDYPATGVTTKDISGILSPLLDYDRPDLAQHWKICTNSVKTYYLQYAQYYGEVPTVKRVSKTANFTACLGGYSKKALLNTSGTDHLANYLLPAPALYRQQRWFESYPTDHMVVRTNQPHFLYFMNMRDFAETLVINIDVQFDNGTSTSVTQFGGLLQPSQKVAVGVGYLQLALDSLTTAFRKVAGYQVYLSEAISLEQRSLKKTFTVERQYAAYTRYILYADSAGNFKTLHAYGKSQVKATVSASTAQRQENEQTPVNGSMSRYDISISENDELNTGYLTGDQTLDAIQELMLAKYAYRVFGETLVPITITNKEMLLEADGQYLNAMKIEYQLAYKEVNYTGDTGALRVPSLNSATQSINEI